jgi:hypothetical protein
VWVVTDAVQLAPFDEDSYYQDPLGFFARLRESRPVAPVRMPGYGRAWIVTRYADVRTVLTDPRLAKDVHRWPGGGRSRPSEATGVYAHMLHADPPDHTRLRRLVQKVFTRRLAALRPRAEEIAAGLLEEMAAARGDVIDLLGAYARPLPIAVLCELLGIPVADRAWIAATVTAYDERAEQQRVERELAAYFTELIAARRAEPGDDLVSALVVARGNADGGRGRADRQRAPCHGLPAGHGGLRHHRQPDRLRHPGAADAPRGEDQAAAGPVAAPGGRRGAAPVHQPGEPRERPVHHRGRTRRRRGDPGRASGFCPRPVPPTGIPPGSPTRTASTSTATPAATSPSATAFTTAWALPWPAWRPRSPSAPCSPASRESRSRSLRRNSAGVPSA